MCTTVCIENTKKRNKHVICTQTQFVIYLKDRIIYDIISSKYSTKQTADVFYFSKQNVCLMTFSAKIANITFKQLIR